MSIRVLRKKNGEEVLQRFTHENKWEDVPVVEEAREEKERDDKSGKGAGSGGSEKK